MSSSSLWSSLMKTATLLPSGLRLKNRTRRDSVGFDSKPSPIPPNWRPSQPLFGWFGSPADAYQWSLSVWVVAGGRRRFAGCQCRFVGYFEQYTSFWGWITDSVSPLDMVNLFFFGLLFCFLGFFVWEVLHTFDFNNNYYRIWLLCKWLTLVSTSKCMVITRMVYDYYKNSHTVIM